jgi:hypothetical protein
VVDSPTQHTRASQKGALPQGMQNGTPGNRNTVQAPHASKRTRLASWSLTTAHWVQSGTKAYSGQEIWTGCWQLERKARCAAPRLQLGHLGGVTSTSVPCTGLATGCSHRQGWGSTTPGECTGGPQLLASAWQAATHAVLQHVSAGSCSCCSAPSASRTWGSTCMPWLHSSREHRQARTCLET